MRIVFFGCTKYSEEILIDLIDRKHQIIGIFSITKAFNISYSVKKVKNFNFADLSSIAKEKNIPFFIVDGENGKKLNDYEDIIRELNPDLLLVLGWYYMVPKNIRELANYGAWGIHASLLPNYAGGAPLVWAIIEGKKSTGVTLFRFEDGVDDGDIISQVEFNIEDNETIKEVYEKAIFNSKLILRSSLENIDNVSYTKQDKTKIKIYAQRSPEDGLINWSESSKKIKDFIRAQTKPYPGAFTIINNKKVIIWDADIEEVSPEI